MVEIPYSTISAIDFAQACAARPVHLAGRGQRSRRCKDDEIALNAWAVEQLGRQAGRRDSRRLFRAREHSWPGRDPARRRLKLAAIVAMTGRGADRNLTPELRGITDQKSIADWDPPFPFEPVACAKWTKNIGIAGERRPRRLFRSPPGSGCGAVALAKRRLWNSNPAAWPIDEDCRSVLAGQARSGKHGHAAHAGEAESHWPRRRARRRSICCSSASACFSLRRP